MPEQLSFLDDEETPPEAPKAKPSRMPKVNGQEPYSLFFSIFPGAQDAARIAEQCAALRRQHGLVGKPLLPHRLHITLLDLGNYADVPQDLIDAAIRAGDSLVSSQFEVTFDRAMSFPSSGTYVLCGGQGTAHLKGFQKTLREAMERHGVRAKRGFTPHMTLLYDRTPVAEHPVEPVAWWAAEFVLIRSHVGQGIYDELGRWTLSAE